MARLLVVVLLVVIFNIAAGTMKERTGGGSAGHDIADNGYGKESSRSHDYKSDGKDSRGSRKFKGKDQKVHVPESSKESNESRKGKNPKYSGETGNDYNKWSKGNDGKTKGKDSIGYGNSQYNMKRCDDKLKRDPNDSKGKGKGKSKEKGKGDTVKWGNRDDDDNHQKPGYGDKMEHH